MYRHTHKKNTKSYTNKKKKCKIIGCVSRIRIDPVVFENNAVPGCEIWQYELRQDHGCDKIITCNQEIKKSKRFLSITKEELRKVRELRRENLKLQLAERHHEIKCRKDERIALQKEEAMVKRANKTKPKKKRRSKRPVRGVPIKKRARKDDLENKHKRLTKQLNNLKASQKKYDLRQRELTQLDHDLAVVAGIHVPENE